MAFTYDRERGNLEVHNFVFSPPIQVRWNELPGSVESKLTLVNDFYSLGAAWLTPPSFVQSKSNFRLFGGELCLFVHWGHIPQSDAVLTLRFFKIWSVFWLFGMKIIWSPPVANLIMYTWNGACNWHFQWIWNRIDVSRADSRGSCYEGLCTVRLLLTMHYACEDVVVSP